MPFTHLLLAVLVAVVWGINFIFLKLGLDEISPLFLCALRFIFASLPAIFFIKPPKAPVRKIILYGLIMFDLQFSCLFLGLYFGMTPGMASVIAQVQVFFSLFFAAFFLKLQPSFKQVLGALVSFLGIGLIGLHCDQNITALGFIFILGAAAAWGTGNLITKQLNDVNMISLVIWGSFVASIPMLLIALIVEGPSRIMDSYQHLSWKGISSVFYTVYISTWVGYGVWNWLLSRHNIATVVPFSLMIPIIAILSSVLILGESLEPWKLMAGFLVILGLYINIGRLPFINIKIKQEACQNK